MLSVLFIHQVKAVVLLLTVYRIGKPPGDGLLLFLERQPYGGSCNDGVRRHVPRIVIPCHAVPNEQAHVDFLELRNGVFQYLLINIGLLFRYVHYARVKVILHLCQVAVTGRAVKQKVDAVAVFLMQGGQTVQREVVTRQFIRNFFRGLPDIRCNPVPVIVPCHFLIDADTASRFASSRTSSSSNIQNRMGTL